MWTTQPERPRLPYGVVPRTPRPIVPRNTRGMERLSVRGWIGQMTIENHDNGECVVIRIPFFIGSGSAQHCYDGIKEKGGLR